jgi:hypothetical protein
MVSIAPHGGCTVLGRIAKAMRPPTVPIKHQVKKGERMGTSLKGRKTVVLLLGAMLSVAWSVNGPRVTAALEVGDQAPDFTLPSTTGEKISLSQFRGKTLVLLEFYGADFSPV